MNEWDRQVFIAETGIDPVAEGEEAVSHCEWKPIDTVPHGQWVYVIAKGASCGGVAMLADYWINPDMRPDRYADRATHWMPLPPPPEE